MTARKGRASGDAVASRAYDVEEHELAAATTQGAQVGSVTDSCPKPASVMVDVARIRPSPFQKVRRPSTAALLAAQHAIEAAGSLEALIGEAGTKIYGRLSAEARDLVDLAADIGAMVGGGRRGVEQPIEVRDVGGEREVLSGHRRLAAAGLAGMTVVPVVEHGVVSDADALEIVGRRNGMRSDPGSWHDAQLLLQKKSQRLAAGLPSGTRPLGAIMGYSHMRASHLLNIVAAFPESLLEQLAPGDPSGSHELLGRLGHNALLRLAAIGEPQHRLLEARRRLGLEPAGSAERASQVVRPTSRRRSRSDGGFSLIVTGPIEQMDGAALEALELELSTQLRRVQLARRDAAP